MPRRPLIIRILLCVILVSGGIITTVAVAWGLGWLSTRTRTQTLPRLAGLSEDWLEDGTPFTDTDALRTVLVVDFESRAGTSVRAFEAWADPNRINSRKPSLAVICLRIQNGWPMLALQGGAWDRYENDRFEPTVDETRWRIGRYSFVYGPIFPGFIINTLLYAVVWFGALFLYRTHRRAVRRWQGYCPMCKYDLRSDLATGCPECGWGREGG